MTSLDKISIRKKVCGEGNTKDTAIKIFQKKRRWVVGTFTQRKCTQKKYILFIIFSFKVSQNLFPGLLERPKCQTA